MSDTEHLELTIALEECDAKNEQLQSAITLLKAKIVELEDELRSLTSIVTTGSSY